MTQAFLLRVHRWIFVTFAIPLAVIIFTGLILSFQPVLQRAGVTPGSITLAQIEGYLAKHDRQGAARQLRVDHFEKTIAIQGGGPGAVIDLRAGGETGKRSWITELMAWARPAHEHFVFGLEEITRVPIVLISTIGMVFGMAIGILMGLPRIRNSIAGWHKATAWFLLPLLILSPLTGIFMALRITFSEPAGRVPGASLLDAVRMIAQKHDLSGLHSIRSLGGRQIAIVSEGNSRFTYIVSKDVLRPAPSNWPRVFHQGDFLGIWGGVMNVALSLAFILLLSTGVWMWGRHTFRQRRRATAVPAE
jgi:PepSY-associated TM region